MARKGEMPEAIDRRRLVRRHNPVLTSAHPAGVLTVGNGDIALTVDISGLQTFPSFHELVPDPHRVVRDGLSGLPEQRPRVFDADDFQIPLRTQSTWGWYETRTDRELRLEDTTTLYETSRGPVPYLDRMGLQRAGDPIAEEFAAGAWYHFNPRRAHLGRLALVRPDGTALDDPAALTGVRTELDLWTGTIQAAYVLDGERVRVITASPYASSPACCRADGASPGCSTTSRTTWPPSNCRSRNRRSGTGTRRATGPHGARWRR
jgi:hypothetical protein